RDANSSVLLIEAGPGDNNALIKMPKGFGKLQGNPKYAWHFPQKPFPPMHQHEIWARGKVLGGSSAINGMIYNRGNQADFDHLAELGLPAWSWDNVVAAYREIEDNELGATPTRGSGGPLHVSHLRGADPIGAEIIAAGGSLGWKPVDDYNDRRRAHRLRDVHHQERPTGQRGSSLHPPDPGSAQPYGRDRFGRRAAPARRRPHHGSAG